MNKKEKKRIRRELQHRLEKEENIKKYPDQCFCEFSEFNVDMNEVIGYGSDWYSPYDYNKTNPIKDPIYRCKTCGKQRYYSQCILIA